MKGFHDLWMSVGGFSDLLALCYPTILGNRQVYAHINYTCVTLSVKVYKGGYEAR